MFRAKGEYSSQTDSFDWDTNPHTPRLYFKPAPPLHLPRHNDLLGLHRLNMGMEKYYASPEKADAGCSPFAAAANLETL